MKFCEIIIEPTTAFGTPLKGDTIFGHFCWQAAESDLLNGGLDQWMKSYKESPFVIFTSAIPRLSQKGRTYYALPRPFLPVPASPGLSGSERYNLLDSRKIAKKKKYLLTGEELKPVFSADNYRTKEELFTLHLESLPAQQQKDLKRLEAQNRKLSGKFEQAHNSINRISMTTGSGSFSPFSSINIYYQPNVRLSVFALFDETATDLDRIKKAFVHMGRWGFGRDASTGLGKFEVHEANERQFPKAKKTSCYTLAPCVPAKESIMTGYFTPFTRFGKHGAALICKGKPFKNPVVMADEGAILTPRNPDDLNKPYIGTAITNLSKADDRTVMQGYTIYLPCDIEELK